MKFPTIPKFGGPSLIGNRKGGDMLAVTVSVAVTANVRPMIRLVECSVEFSARRSMGCITSTTKSSSGRLDLPRLAPAGDRRFSHVDRKSEVRDEDPDVHKFVTTPVASPLGNLNFTLVLSDVKLTRLSAAGQEFAPDRPVRVEITGNSLPTPLATEWSSSGNWPGISGRAKCDFGTSEILKTETLDVVVYEQDGNRNFVESARTDLNVENLANGPFLHDLPVGSFGRLAFSLKMTQRCRVSLEVKSAAFVPRVDEDDMVISETSDAVEDFRGIGLSKKSEGQTVGVEKFGICVSLGADVRNTVCEITEISDHLQVESTAVKLRTESMRFLVRRSASDTPVGELWLPFARLYEMSTGLFGHVAINEKVWHEGHWVGHLHLEFGTISGFPKFVQMSFGVYTGKTGGVTRSPFAYTMSAILGGGVFRPGSPVSSDRHIGEEHVHVPTQIGRLQKILDSLKTSDGTDKYQIGNELSEMLAQGRKGKGFEYADERALSVGEEVLLQIGERVFELLGQGKLTYTQVKMFSRVLGTILEHAEIEGLVASVVIKGDDQKLWTRRMTTRVRYREWIENMLSWSLEQLNRKRASDLYDTNKELIPAILVRAFFANSNFRAELLYAVISDAEAEEEIDEWRGSGFALWPHDKLFEDTVNASRTIKLLFDLSAWNDSLDAFQGREGRAAVLEEVKKDMSPRWKQRFVKKRTTFCFFVKAWLKHVGDAAGEGSAAELFWHHIPGYRVLLKGVLLSIKRRRVDMIPDALVNAASGFLRNPKTLSVLVKLVLHRTNEYEQYAVTACVKVLDYFFLNLEVRKSQIPVEFDFSVFFDACHRLLFSDGAKNVYNTIWLLYRHFPLFVSPASVDFARHGLIDLFLTQRTFDHLLTHWAWFVRDRFILLVLFRLAPFETVEKPPTSPVNDFSRFRSVLTKTLMQNLECYSVPVTAFMALSIALPSFASLPTMSLAQTQYLKLAEATWREQLPLFRAHMAIDSDDDRKRNLPCFVLAEVADLDVHVDGVIDGRHRRPSLPTAGNHAAANEDDERSEDLGEDGASGE